MRAIVEKSVNLNFTDYDQCAVYADWLEERGDKRHGFWRLVSTGSVDVEPQYLESTDGKIVLLWQVPFTTWKAMGLLEQASYAGFYKPFDCLLMLESVYLENLPKQNDMWENLDSALLTGWDE